MKHVYEVCRRLKGQSCCDSRYFSSKKAAEKWSESVKKNGYETEIATWNVYGINDI